MTGCDLLLEVENVIGFLVSRRWLEESVDNTFTMKAGSVFIAGESVEQPDDIAASYNAGPAVCFTAEK